MIKIRCKDKYNFEQAASDDPGLTLELRRHISIRISDIIFLNSVESFDLKKLDEYS